MTERPIIFSAAMVRAMIDGRKTQTRRLIKLAGRWPDYIGPRGCTDDPTCWGWWDDRHGDYVSIEKEDGQRMGWRDWVGAYRAGDRLWVREAHALWADEPSRWAAQTLEDSDDACIYRADYLDGIGALGIGGGPWRPSIHMFRWASRLTLTVTDVRVHQLQDITEDDAQAEGLVQAYEGWATDLEGRCWGPTARDSFVQLFDSLHGFDASEANPRPGIHWVAALSFDVHHGNIDEIGGDG